MLKLPDVTLNIIETRQHMLGRLALRDCLAKVEFGDVLIMTDKPEWLVPPTNQKCRVVEVPDWNEKLGWSRANWFDISPHLRTSHVLCIQWDSWVVAPDMWTDEFLNYDYVGAPWWYRDGLNVGNGGFCLRSTSLLRYIRLNRDRFPCVNALDDDLYCRKYRPQLQAAGFEWATDDLAFRFAIEVESHRKRARHFGFHAAYNFDYGCEFDRERILERARIMVQSRHMTVTHPYFWHGLIKTNPWLLEALGAENGITPEVQEIERQHISETIMLQMQGNKPLNKEYTVWEGPGLPPGDSVAMG